MNSDWRKNNLATTEEAVENFLIERQLQSVIYLAKIIKHWKMLVGEPLSRKTAPVKLEGKTLVVTTQDAAYSHYLKFSKKNMLNLIASPAICGVGAVDDIQFRVGKVVAPKTASEIEKKREKKVVRIDGKSRDQAQKCSRTIQDEKLRKAFSNLMANMVAKFSHEG